jgi:hypothetical protein
MGFLKGSEGSVESHMQACLFYMAAGVICKHVVYVWHLVSTPVQLCTSRQTDTLTGRTRMRLPSWMQMETSSTETLSTLPLPRPLPPHPGPYFSFSLSVSFLPPSLVLFVYILGACCILSNLLLCVRVCVVANLLFNTSVVSAGRRVHDGAVRHAAD